LKRAGLPPERLALVGFSQGTMMSLHVAPRRPQAFAAVVGYSGRLAAEDTLAAEIKSRPPFFLAHGTEDPVVPFDSLAQAERALKSVGIAVETLACRGMSHGIDDAGLRRGGEFLLRHLR
jgi:phospholipase/carboxylesterase